MSDSSVFAVTTTADVTVANTAKTVLAVVNSNTKQIQVIGFEFSSGNATISTGSWVVELCEFSQAGAGTPGAAETAVQDGAGYGGVASLVTSVQRGYTAEPTALLVVHRRLRVPAGGVYARDFPLGLEIAIDKQHTFGIRVTGPSASTENVNATINWRE